LKEKDPELTQDIFDRIDAAGDLTPYKTKWAEAAGIPPRLLYTWLRWGKSRGEGIYHDLFLLIEDLDEYWIGVAEDEVRRFGLAPFEEVRVQGQCIDEGSSAPLNVQFTIRPPNPIYGLRYLAAKRPKQWGKQALEVDLNPKAEKPVINLGIVPSANGKDVVKRG